MPPHPDSDRLARAIERLAGEALPWSGTVYRSASPRYANRDDLATGQGSKIAGARWNPRASFAAVYASLDPHTALDEVLAHFRYYRIAESSAMPRVLAALQVRLQRVLDLNNGGVRSALRVSQQRMLSEPWRKLQSGGKEAITQAIGRLAYRAGWEGLLVPSAARRQGVNLIVFPANLNPPDSWLRIQNRDELPASFE
jgi:RES domain-containing protein